jgi:hypothetical protein
LLFVECDELLELLLEEEERPLCASQGRIKAKRSKITIKSLINLYIKGLLRKK